MSTSTNPVEQTAATERAQEKKRRLQDEKDSRHRRIIKEIEEEETRIRRQLTNLKAEKDLMSKILAQLKDAKAKKRARTE